MVAKWNQRASNSAGKDDMSKRVKMKGTRYSSRYSPANMARPGRLELPTLCLEGRRSIQLSYGRILNFDSKTCYVSAEHCFGECFSGPCARLIGERRIFWMARNKRFTLSRAKLVVRHSPRRSLHDANTSD